MVWAWLAFLAVVVAVLALLRAAAPSTIRSSTSWGVGLATLGLSFATIVYAAYDDVDAAVLYLAGYLLECAMAADNFVVVAVLFRARRVPKHAQPRLLWWGLLSAMIAQTIVLIGGAYLVSFDGALYLLGASFLYGAIKMFDDEPEGGDLVDGPLTKRVFLAIVAVQAVFALDSFSALSVSDSAFILVTSTVMATLMLHGWYFVLERAWASGRIRTPRIALTLLLLLVGVKLLLHRHVDVPPIAMLIVLAALIAGGIFESCRPVR